MTLTMDPLIYVQYSQLVESYVNAYAIAGKEGL